MNKSTKLAGLLILSLLSNFNKLLIKSKQKQLKFRLTELEPRENKR